MRTSRLATWLVLGAMCLAGASIVGPEQAHAATLGSNAKAVEPEIGNPANEPCLRCHGTPFCDGCHQTSGVGGGVGPQSPHPVGWLDPLSPMGHAREARRNLVSCVSCHESDAETKCVPCHRVGGVAGDPHPPGSGLTMDDALRHGVCRACHVN